MTYSEFCDQIDEVLNKYAGWPDDFTLIKKAMDEIKEIYESAEEDNDY